MSEVSNIDQSKNALVTTRQSIAELSEQLDPITRQLRAVAQSDYDVSRLKPQAEAMRSKLAELKLEEARLVNEVIGLTRTEASSEHIAADTAWRAELEEQRRFTDELRSAMELALKPVRARVAEADERAKAAKQRMQAANLLMPESI